MVTLYDLERLPGSSKGWEKAEDISDSKKRQMLRRNYVQFAKNDDVDWENTIIIAISNVNENVEYFSKTYEDKDSLNLDLHALVNFLGYVFKPENE